MNRLDTGGSAIYQLYPTHEFCNHINFNLNRTISNHSLTGRVLFRLGLADNISEEMIKALSSLNRSKREKHHSYSY